MASTSAKVMRMRTSMPPAMARRTAPAVGNIPAMSARCILKYLVTAV